MWWPEYETQSDKQDARGHTFAQLMPAGEVDARPGPGARSVSGCWEKGRAGGRHREYGTVLYHTVMVAPCHTL